MDVFFTHFINICFRYLLPWSQGLLSPALNSLKGLYALPQLEPDFDTLSSFIFVKLNLEAEAQPHDKIKFLLLEGGVANIRRWSVP